MSVLCTYKFIKYPFKNFLSSVSASLFYHKLHTQFVSFSSNKFAYCYTITNELYFTEKRDILKVISSQSMAQLRIHFREQINKLNHFLTYNLI